MPQPPAPEITARLVNSNRPGIPSSPLTPPHPHTTHHTPGWHYDLNFLTIHGRSRFPGLSVWLADGRRARVAIPPGCLLVQAGKQMEWLTGGAVAAGMHEVGREWGVEGDRVARAAAAAAAVVAALMVCSKSGFLRAAVWHGARNGMREGAVERTCWW
jgi:hypothetical protein